MIFATFSMLIAIVVLVNAGAFILENLEDALGEEKARIKAAGGREQLQTRAFGNAITQEDASLPRPRRSAI